MAAPQTPDEDPRTGPEHMQHEMRTNMGKVQECLVPGKHDPVYEATNIDQHADKAGIKL